MDLRHDISEFIEWDVRNWSAALEFWKANSSKNLAECSALEIGSDYGGLSLWLASEGADVICSDVNGPKPEARTKHLAAGYSKQITYASIDALNIPYTEQFDVVVMKSVLGIVGNPCTKESQARAISEIYKCLKPGGELYFAENLSASRLHRYLRGKYVKWGSKWRYPAAEEMLGFLQGFSRVDHTLFGFAGTFGRNERQRNLLGVADRLIVDRIVPSGWKYIIAGVAVK